MTSEKIDIIVIKFLLDEVDSTDLDMLDSWTQNPENKRKFEHYVKLHYEINWVMSKLNTDAIKKTLSKKIRRDKNPFYKYKIGTILFYAAVMAIGFSIYIYSDDLATDTVSEKKSIKEILIPKEESIILISDDGTRHNIEAGGNGQIHNSNNQRIGTYNQEQLRYEKVSRPAKLLSYNTLNVPNGKRFDVILSDGTHVFLNSGSSLKYPVQFIEGSDRSVFLSGEGYFDVTENKDHPFVVHADKMNIRVLGTKFNVSHYPEEANINTVLVTGSVELYTNKNEDSSATQLLKPGFRAQWSKQDYATVIENVNTRDYTAWVDGKIIFRNSSFLRIRNTLERHFSVTIHCNDANLDQQLFDATFDTESINEILEAFNKSYAIDFKIVDNEVLIN